MHPTHKISKRRRDKRRSHLAIRPRHSVVCPNCGTDKLPHRACGNCGYVRPGLSLRLTKED